MKNFTEFLKEDFEFTQGEAERVVEFLKTDLSRQEIRNKFKVRDKVYQYFEDLGGLEEPQEQKKAFALVQKELRRNNIDV